MLRIKLFSSEEQPSADYFCCCYVQTRVFLRKRNSQFCIREGVISKWNKQVEALGDIRPQGSWGWAVPGSPWKTPPTPGAAQCSWNWWDHIWVTIPSLLLRGKHRNYLTTAGCTCVFFPQQQSSWPWTCPRCPCQPPPSLSCRACAPLAAPALLQPILQQTWELLYFGGTAVSSEMSALLGLPFLPHIKSREKRILSLMHHLLIGSAW